MVKEILEQYLAMEVELPDWIQRYDEASQKEYQTREKQNFLADKFIEYFSQKKLEWNIAISKEIAIAFDHRTVFVLQCLRGSYSSRYSGSKTYDYLLTIFDSGKEIFSLRNFCDEGCYDSLSFRIPIMDLYDTVVAGKKRKQPAAHVCGAQGFNPMLGDTCPAC